ncbi:hypothetical protein LguiA_004208 [Lonicera macranthoides]
MEEETTERVSSSFVVSYSYNYPCCSFLGEAAKVILKCFGFEITTTTTTTQQICQESPDPPPTPPEQQIKASDDTAMVLSLPARPPPNRGRGGQTN